MQRPEESKPEEPKPKESRLEETKSEEPTNEPKHKVIFLSEADAAEPSKVAF